MKKKKGNQASADRVKKYLAGDESSFPGKIVSKNAKKYSFKREESPPLPSGLDQISIRDPKEESGHRKIGKAQVIVQKAPKSAMEQVHCTTCQNYPLFFIEKSEAMQKKKIKSVSAKEQFIATRNMKKLSIEMQQWIYSEVERNRVKILKEDPAELHDLIEKREERHFRIDRIIQYLSDI